MSEQVKQQYPALSLEKTIIFPFGTASLVMEGEEVAKVVKEAHQVNHQVVLQFQKDDGKSQVGVLAQVNRHFELAPTITGVVVEGLRRLKIISEFSQDGTKMVVVEEVDKVKRTKVEEMELKALARSVLEQFKKVVQVEGLVPLLVVDDLQKEDSPAEKVSDLISSVLKMEFGEKINLLETLDVKSRLEILSGKLNDEINIAQAEQRIQNQIEKEINQTQKEFILRERLKAIEKELGIFEEQKEYDLLEEKIHQASLPEDAQKRVLGELQRLRRMGVSSAEVPYIRTYLEWVTDLPWNKKSQTDVDLERARKVLDEDHHGLEKAKERVLEYLAVQKLTGGAEKGSILCFVGPPGTGKTSVGQSIAKALGRKFVRISLGGIKDEAEIRGHRRTYVGAMPGRIIQGLRNAGVKNPVFMMDEIDKIGVDFRGDPSAALLEVLDPAQNNSFSDHYIEIPFDLSEVFFITTANILDPVPPALRDRMEVIEFPGYTEDEKFHIAKKFLLPRILNSHGLSSGKLQVKDEVIRKIITYYTREAGVRDLERKLAEIARKVALKQAQGQIYGSTTVNLENLDDFLGPEEFEITAKEGEDEVGVATGLAWTPVGGEIIFIESSLVPGQGNLTLTGQLGAVMQESAKAALTYVRSKSKQLDFEPKFFYKSDIHIHVPEGAIPKDGPSSGIAIATALASMLTNKKIKKEVALTGEVTLSGRVLKVGGIKEKVLAAHRGGAKIVILPESNKKNLVDIPEDVKKELDFKFVKHMDEVLKMALI